jgi:cytochrome P450
MFVHPHPRLIPACCRARLLAEQVDVQGGILDVPLDFTTIENLRLLDMCVRETLRLNPPLVTVMRQVRSPPLPTPPPAAWGFG